jgi:hypothetical protein
MEKKAIDETKERTTIQHNAHSQTLKVASLMQFGFGSAYVRRLWSFEKGAAAAAGGVLRLILQLKLPP